MTDEEFIRETFELARSARANFNHPFGALLVRNGDVVLRMSDTSIQRSDPTYHPEIALISAICRETGTIHIRDVEMYSSAEPCPMCAGAIRAARIARIVYSVPRYRLAQLVANSRQQPLAGHVSCKDVVSDGGGDTKIVGPILPDQGEQVFSGYSFPSKEDLTVLYRQATIKSGG